VRNRRDAEAKPAPTVCHLCAQIAGEPAADLIHRLLCPAVYKRAVCLETADFAIIPSIGPLVPGHVLVTPKRHVRSFASLPVWHAGAGEALAAGLAKELGAMYDQPVHMFEHGSARSGNAIACSVEHAHLHVVPTAAQVWPLIQSAGAWRELRADPLSTIVADQEYLLYEHPNGKRFVLLTNENPIASQFMRQAFAWALGTPQLWDWRLYPRSEEILSTLLLVSEIDIGCALIPTQLGVSA